jgi:hypothetical protein
MCFFGGPKSNAQAQAEESERQIAAQKELQTQSLQQQQKIADAQAAQNQQQFDYQKAQDDRRLQDTVDQSNRQAAWDQSRNAAAGKATNAVEAAFSRFSPEYFKQYQDDYMANSGGEINRQYGDATKELTYALARRGTLASSTGADQLGLLTETKGRKEADEANTAVTRANALKTQALSAKQGLLQQALSSDTLGSPIAPGSSDSVNAAIDAANRAVSQIGVTSGDYAASIKPPEQSLGTLSGIFAGALGGASNVMSGREDARVAAAYGGPSPGASSNSSGSVKRWS